MCFGEVHHMDVVSHTRTVFGVIVTPKDTQILALAYGNLGDVGHKIVGNAVWIFTDTSALVCTYRVEVAKDRDLEVMIAYVKVLEYLLDKEFRSAIRIGCRGREVLFDGGRGRVTVNSRRGAENYLFTSGCLHRFKQSERSADIVVIVLQRLFHRLAYSFESCKVDHTLYLVFVEHLVKTCPVANVTLFENDLFACKFLHTFDRLFGGVGEVVINHDLEAGF